MLVASGLQAYSLLLTARLCLSIACVLHSPLLHCWSWLHLLFCCIALHCTALACLPVCCSWSLLDLMVPLLHCTALLSACLSAAAQTQAEALVAVVLQPLLSSSSLVAVQVQLLVKLVKEAPQVQPR